MTKRPDVRYPYATGCGAAASPEPDPMGSCCWPDCGRDALGDDLPLCEAHFSQVGSRFIDERTLAGPTYRGIIQRTEQEDRERRLAEQIERGRIATALRQQAADRSVVYYVRTGRYIKIGYTANLRSRLHSLRLDPADVLATERGGRALEAQRHQQFAGDRIGRREDFAPSLAIMEHIRELTEVE